MKFGSLFSGIGAPEIAWQPLGWKCAWVAEIDPFACAVLKRRFPGVPNLGDVTRIDPDAVEPVDLVVFGSPCQDFSAAGQRRGLDGERGNLTLAALRLVAKLRPRWLVFENVPGLLSNWSGDAPSDLVEGEEREADQSSDFAAFLGTVRECGYLGCWRVLDAQFAGVPQRRRRVFFVGHLGDWRPAAAVLFEPESLRGDPAPRREAGQGTAPDPVVGTLQSGGTPNSEDGSGRGTPLVCGTIGAENIRHTTGMESGGDVLMQSGMSVRRLTPRECERLQGLPDDWTLIHYRGKPAADDPRYRAIGNSMAVPVVRWLGQRIQMFYLVTQIEKSDFSISQYHPGNRRNARGSMLQEDYPAKAGDERNPRVF